MNHLGISLTLQKKRQLSLQFYHEKFRLGVHPANLPNQPTQITYSLERGIVGILSIRGM